MTAKIAKTLAEARVGDLVWVQDKGKKKTDREWALSPVVKVGRTYVHVQDGPGTAGFAKDGGDPQTVNDWTPYTAAYGSEERTALAWELLAVEIGRKAQACTDPKILAVAGGLFGVAAPEDFSVVPEA